MPMSRPETSHLKSDMSAEHHLCPPPASPPSPPPAPPRALRGFPAVEPHVWPPSEMDTLRMIVTERLTAAVDDILQEFGRTVSRYREQIDVQRRQLDSLRSEEGSWKPAAAPQTASSWIRPSDEPLLNVQLEQTDGVDETHAGSSTAHIKTEVGVEDFAVSEPNGDLNPAGGSEGRLLTDCSDTEDSGDYCRDPEGQRSSWRSSDPSHQPGAAFSCKVCGESYQRINHLLTHSTAHLRDCGLCGKHLAPAEDLKLHLRGHRTTAFCCSVCGQSFTLRGNLRIHMMIHSGERPYACSVCGKSFSRRATLVRHVRSHTGEKPFTCTYCGHSFVEKGNLTVHLRTHTGEKPYWCSNCDRRFSQLSSFQKHPCQRRALT